MALTVNGIEITKVIFDNGTTSEEVFPGYKHFNIADPAMYVQYPGLSYTKLNISPYCVFSNHSCSGFIMTSMSHNPGTHYGVDGSAVYTLSSAKATITDTSMVVADVSLRYYKTGVAASFTRPFNLTSKLSLTISNGSKTLVFSSPEWIFNSTTHPGTYSATNDNIGSVIVSFSWSGLSLAEFTGYTITGATITFPNISAHWYPESGSRPQIDLQFKLDRFTITNVIFGS